MRSSAQVHSALGSRQLVLHVTESFVEGSQAWLYDLVATPGTFQASVLCERRIREESFPFDAALPALPSSHRFGRDWLARQMNLHTRFGVAPHNYWRRALRTLAPKADVVHAHFGHVGWMAIDAGLAPVVVSFYGFDAYARQWLAHWGRSFPEMFRDGALFVAEGPAMAERLVALGAPRGRVRVLPLIADTSSLSWRAPRTNGLIRITMAGRLVQKKGFQLGLEAFARLNRPDASLTIVGSGPEAGTLKRLASEYQLSNVGFVPFLTRKEYRDLLSDSDILLQPSMTAGNGDSEGGAPTVLFDAQAIGTVIVATDHADIPFVVAPGAAYLAREGDVDSITAALETAIDTRKHWSGRSRAGREHVEAQHAPRRVAAARDEIYAEAIRLGDRR